MLLAEDARAVRFLILFRDAKFTTSLDAVVDSVGIETI